MKILEAGVKWYPDFGNYPDFWVTVDNVPELKYTKHEDIYFAENDGYVEFLIRSNNQNGFGGGTFNLPMVDGSTVKLKGPWSSRASYCNSLGLTPCSEVIANGFGRANLTLDRLFECAEITKTYLIFIVYADPWYEKTARLSAGLEMRPEVQIRITPENKEIINQYIGREFNFKPSVHPDRLEKP